MEEKDDKAQFVLVHGTCFAVDGVHHGFSTTRGASDVLVGHSYLWWSRSFISHGELPGQILVAVHS